MTKEENPIVITISEVSKGRYTLQSDDRRCGTNEPSPELGAYLLIATMFDLTERFNSVGHAVLFEVD